METNANHVINDEDVDRLFTEALAADLAQPGPGTGFKQRLCRLAQKARQASQITPANPLDRHDLSPATAEAGHEQIPALPSRF